MYSTFELAFNVLTDKSLHNPFMIHFLCPFFNLWVFSLDNSIKIPYRLYFFSKQLRVYKSNVALAPSSQNNPRGSVSWFWGESKGKHFGPGVFLEPSRVEITNLDTSTACASYDRGPIGVERGPSSEPIINFSWKRNFTRIYEHLIIPKCHEQLKGNASLISFEVFWVPKSRLRFLSLKLETILF